jgi:hypothetical protein
MENPQLILSQSLELKLGHYVLAISKRFIIFFDLVRKTNKKNQKRFETKSPIEFVYLCALPKALSY